MQMKGWVVVGAIHFKKALGVFNFACGNSTQVGLGRLFYFLFLACVSVGGQRLCTEGGALKGCLELLG